MKKLSTKVDSIPSAGTKADSDMQPIAGSSSHNSSKPIVGGSVFDNENQIPIVGKYYNVRCALMEYNGKIEAVPIIGNEHKDIQFGVNFSHFHIDGRFKSEMIDENGFTNSILPTDKTTSTGYYGTFLKVEIRRKKCVRLTTGIKPPRIKEKYIEWYNTMIRKSCKGKKCPHLGTTMLEVNGQLVCPLHKLRGCQTTLKIIEYAD